MTEKLYKRSIVDTIVKYLYTDDIIVIHGARQVGKTHILYYLDNMLKLGKRETHYIDLEDGRFVTLLNEGVHSFIQHLKERGFTLDKRAQKLFVFIDEIQYLENPSSFLKLMIDHHSYIKLVVSGSSSFNIKRKFTDSLVGRTVNFEIFPLSFQEFLQFKEYESDPRIVLTKIKEEEMRQRFQEYVMYGGYPKIVLTEEWEKKETYLQQIIDTYIKKDIRDLADIRDIHTFNKLLEVLASQSGQLLNVTELSNTCKLAKKTVDDYLYLMEQTYIIKLVRPYYHNMRSELFKTPKIYMYDTGVQQMLWLKTFPKTILGNVFETAVFAELVKKYGKDTVFYWRTADKKEVDFIVKEKNALLPIEVKTHFARFNPTSLNYFTKHYQVGDYKVVALEGERIDEHYVYPWEL